MFDPLSKTEPNLIGMVIGWSLAMFMFSFVDQKYSKETRGPKVSKRVCPGELIKSGTSSVRVTLSMYIKK
jgi:hypothetical protein